MLHCIYQNTADIVTGINFSTVNSISEQYTIMKPLNARSWYSNIVTQKTKLFPKYKPRRRWVEGSYLWSICVVGKSINFVQLLE